MALTMDELKELCDQVEITPEMIDSMRKRVIQFDLEVALKILEERFLNRRYTV